MMAKVLGEVRLAGHPESFQLERGGSRVFVNVPTARHIAVVDRTSMKISGAWPVTTWGEVAIVLILCAPLEQAQRSGHQLIAARGGHR